MSFFKKCPVCSGIFRREGNWRRHFKNSPLCADTSHRIQPALQVDILSESDSDDNSTIGTVADPSAPHQDLPHDNPFDVMSESGSHPPPLPPEYDSFDVMSELNLEDNGAGVPPAAYLEPPPPSRDDHPTDSFDSGTGTDGTDDASAHLPPPPDDEDDPSAQCTWVHC